MRSWECASSSFLSQGICTCKPFADEDGPLQRGIVTDVDVWSRHITKSPFWSLPGLRLRRIGVINMCIDMLKVPSKARVWHDSLPEDVLLFSALV